MFLDYLKCVSESAKSKKTGKIYEFEQISPGVKCLALAPAASELWRLAYVQLRMDRYKMTR